MKGTTTSILSASATPPTMPKPSPMKPTSAPWMTKIAMIERGRGDIIVTSSLAAHYPTPWEPVYAASKWAIDCFVQVTRRQVFKHGIRVGAISPGPVATGLLADWPAQKLADARASGSLIEPAEVAEVILFMLTRPRHMTIRDVVMLPTNFDL